MSGLRRNPQQELAREPNERGEAPITGVPGAESVVAVAAPESPAATMQLMEEVCERENLVRAWQRVRENKGAPGVDGMTIDDAKSFLREHWPDIRSQLLAGTYQPQPVKRVEIPKPDGGVRKLGVPSVVDRLIVGFSIANDGSERRIAPQALAKFKARIRKITRRTRGRSLPQIVEELRSYLIGWRSYFGFCQTPRVLTNLEAWIRRRLRMYLWRQWKNGPKRFKELRRRGIARFLAAVAAGSPTGSWRMSGHPAVSLGLPRI